EGNPYAVERESIRSPQDALQALIAGPTPQEASLGLCTAFPSGTTILNLGVLQNGLHADFSKEILEGMDEVQVEWAFRQIYWTAAQFGLNESVRMSINGDDISKLLERRFSQESPSVDSLLEKTPLAGVGAGGIFRKRVMLSALGGYFWDGSDWRLQCAVVEGHEPSDFVGVRLAERVKVYLESEGTDLSVARDMHVRQRVEGISGKPRWQEASYIWLSQNGFPCIVYANSTGLCDTAQGATSRRNDDIRCAALAGQYDPNGATDITVLLSVQDLLGDPHVVEPAPRVATFYGAQSASGYDQGSMRSRLLADAIQRSLTSSMAGAGFQWASSVPSRGQGSFVGQVRISEQPSALVELSGSAADRIRDPFFQSCCAWAIYSGVCRYYGAVPRREMFSAEVVSHTFPETMIAGEARNAKVIYRNKSVLWDGEHGFALVAVDGSDPFAAPLHRIPKGVTVETEE
ncbi:MAG TPA: GerMN domain-containing protein, partial [bacterium]|nr:GerMN domain-containing protein [bacterium]